MLFCVPANHEQDIPATYTTPEAGYVTFPFSGSNFCNAIKPVTHSRFVFRNRLIVNKNFSAEEIKDAEYELATHSKKLDQMGIVPSPFPLKRMLTEDQIALVYRLYKMKGLSYGNMSLRRKNKGEGKPSFWMTARGVDKANIRTFGKDFLLVKDYDEAQSEMVVSVPEDHDHTARASVDAIEHYMIYESFPEVGAIVHVHAWMDAVEATKQNYPCGTNELASSVVSLLKESSKPEQTIIGLKNHGLTITGPDLDNIFNRITGKLRTEVPMKL
jgi:ribulose-5-phosphate 4-epimerase/fuculose-1-phosphate aldolase